MGRQSSYTEETAQEICERLSSGIPLAEICRDESMPGYRTVYDWMDANPSFSANIARARKDGHDSISAECLRISNTPVIGEEQTVKANGEIEVKRGDMLGHRKLQIETRLKLLAKWDPKRYGDRLELAGDGDNPLVTKSTIDVSGLSTEALAELMALRDAANRG
jgi:hypothetical protein